MKTYFILEIDSCRYILQKDYSQCSVTQQEEGTITGIVAIVKGFDNCKYWDQIDNSINDIKEIVYINNSYVNSAIVKKLNNHLTK